MVSLNSASAQCLYYFHLKLQVGISWTLLYSLCLQTSILYFSLFVSVRCILVHIFKVVIFLKHVKHCYFSFCIVGFQYLKSLWD